MAKGNNLYIRIEDEEKEKLTRLAENKKMNISEYVRELIKNDINAKTWLFSTSKQEKTAILSLYNDLHREGTLENITRDFLIGKLSFGVTNGRKTVVMLGNNDDESIHGIYCDTLERFITNIKITLYQDVDNILDDK